MSAILKLTNRMEEANSLACCGLDPDPKRIPHGSTDNEDLRIYRFLIEAVDAAAPHVCAFKVQKAFFDRLPDGKRMLFELVLYIKHRYPTVPVFIDCKVGDIDNTMDAYVDYLLGELDADGIVVNPYMGDEVLAACDDYPGKAIIVLARTSNPGAAVVQDALMADGRPLWQYMLELITGRWNGHGNLIPVISSTAGLDLSTTRRLIPDDMPILLAGVGAQGGDYSDIKALLNKRSTGVFVNSSRGILYPPQSEGLTRKESIAFAAGNLKEDLNRARR